MSERTTGPRTDTPSHPRPLPPQPESIPPELRAASQWVAWRYEYREDKWSKPPVNPHTGKLAKTTDSTTWGTFDQALAYARDRLITPGRGGVGFVVTEGDPFLGVDIDGCRDPDTGDVSPGAREIVAALDSYTEISPSGTGLRIIVRAKLRAGSRNRKDTIEIYDRVRFFTLTGHRYAAAPLAISERQAALDALHTRLFPAERPAPAPVAASLPMDDDEALIARAMQARNGDQFRRLWAGDTGDYGGDESRADMALCGMLAFWFGGDEARIERVFARSGLVRSKWTDRPDYRRRTIAAAISGKTDFYPPSPRPPRDRPAPHAAATAHATGAADTSLTTADAEEIDAAPAGQQRPPSDAAMLIRLAADVLFFQTPTGDTYASYEHGDHRETHPLGRGSRFKQELATRFYTLLGRPPSTNAMTSAMPIFEDRANQNVPTIEVYTRIGKHDGKIYIDLADEAWQAIEIDADGWRIVQSPPVHFRRARGLLPLPEPTRGGNLIELRPFINVPDDADWVLVAAWLVMAGRPEGPYPILDIHGEQGSAKTTTAKRLRQVLDPARPLTRAQPKEEQDLLIAARNSQIIAIDNVSHLPDWLSDAHCRIATGAGFGARALYTNDEEQLFDGARPQIFTAIEEVATRGDFLDRSIVIRLPAIPASNRIPEGKADAAFAAKHPRILGALCDALSLAIARVPTVRLSESPRMADFAMWAVAAEPALGAKEGSFLAAYARNRETAVSTELEASVIGTLIVGLACEQEGKGWEGTTQELLSTLTQRADATGGDVKSQKGWPTRANKLSGMLTRLAPALRTSGVLVETRRTKKGSRVTLRTSGDTRPLSAERVTMGDDQTREGDDQIPTGDDQTGGDRPPQMALPGSENTQMGDDGDDGDDKIPTLPPMSLPTSQREKERKEGDEKGQEGRVGNQSSPSSPSVGASAAVEEPLWQWIADVEEGTVTDYPEEVRRAMQGVGFPFDNFAPVRASAAQLKAHLIARYEGEADRG